jgi:histone acetyltransferase (RNA polymerase elongator complex component)
MILPVFIPFMGCPNRCLFCNQNAITGVLSNYESSIVEQIEKYLLISSKWDEIAFFGGSFTCLEKKTREALYLISKRYNFKNIRISTRPDCISGEIIDELKNNNVKTVEIGVQSTSEKVLKLNFRKYGKNEIFFTSNLLKNNFFFCTQLMTGMYGENLEDILETISDILKISPHFARIYPTVVLKESPLEALYNKRLFIPDKPETIIAKTALIYSYLTSNSIKVIRIGLPESEHLKSEISDGFYHPAIGDIVKTVSKIAYILKFNKIPEDHRSFKGVIGRSFKNLEICRDPNWLKKFCGGYIEDNWRFIERASDIVCQTL